MIYMKSPAHPVDMSRVRTVVYHLPEGKYLVVPTDGMEEFLEFGNGSICDTSDINGVIHFFPRGNA